MPAHCELGGRFSRCKLPSEHTCQYCGRSFCARHTHYLHGYEAVCNRKECAAKQEDMAIHVEYRQEVVGKNRAHLCGEPGCAASPATNECSLCKGHFCQAHVSERMYWLPDGFSRIERTVSVCSHCWSRRKIWQKR